MSSFRIRPRFKQLSPLKKDEIREKLTDALAQEKHPCKGVVKPQFILITIPEKEQHFWSPQLSIRLEEHDDGTIIRGHYGPKPNIWTMFAFGYVSIAVLGSFLAMYLLSQWSLGIELQFVWGIPFLAVSALVLYFIAQF